MNLRSRLQPLADKYAKSNKKQYIVTSGIVGAALLMSASIFATGPSAEPTIIEEKAWPVSVVYAEPQTMKPAFKAYGKVESNRIARIRSDLVLRIDNVLVREGDWVNTDDLLG